MSFKAFKINGKTVKIPIIQGGMGIRISLHKLANACMKSGIVATISAAQPGFLNKNFKKDPVRENKKELLKEISKIREENPNGILGVNLMHAATNYSEYARYLSTLDIDFIISGAGLPVDLPEYIKGTNVKGAFIVSSARAARLLLKSWDRRYSYMPDFIVCEGPLAGGHLGFTKEDFDNGKVESLESIVVSTKNIIKPFEEKYGISIPVIAAGGIHDGKDMANIINAGADGVQIATRFIGSFECDADDSYKQMLINSKEEDIVRTVSPAGLPGRAVRNYLTEKVKDENIKVSYCVDCLKSCKKIGIPYCITEQLGNSANGDINGLLFTGAKGYLINKLDTVENIVREIVEDCKRELKLVGGTV